MADDRKYTFTEVDTILCMWDAMLTCNKLEPEPEHQAMMEFWENNGTAHMRSIAVDLGLWVEAIWLKLPERIRDNSVFDWEFVPNLLAHVKWEAHDYDHPSIEDMVAMMIAKHGLMEN